MPTVKKSCYGGTGLNEVSPVVAEINGHVQFSSREENVFTPVKAALHLFFLSS